MNRFHTATSPWPVVRRRGEGSEVRIVGDESERIVVARVCVYNVTDDYGTRWLPGCFAESLKRKLPKVVWSHIWAEPIGQVTAFRDTDAALEVTMKLSDFAAVPRARQAWVQLRDGDVTDWSFGFMRQKWVTSDDDTEDWGEEMLQAGLDEVSPVLVGAVSGTKTLEVRGAGRDVARVRQALTSPSTRVRGLAGDWRDGLVSDDQYLHALRSAMDRSSSLTLEAADVACALVEFTTSAPRRRRR